MNPNDLLKQLHDIHLPPAVSWWPLAWGWYVLMVIFIIAGIALALWLRHRYRIRCLRNEALNKLLTLKQKCADPTNTANSIARLNKLLKQIAMHRFPNENIATLYGQDWLDFLDHSGKTDAFSKGIGKFLITGSYQNKPIENTNEMFALAERWIRRQF